MSTETADRNVQSSSEMGGDSRQALLAVLGTQIVRLRERRGWPQNELARRLGVSPARLGHWERGEHAPPLQDLLALGRELGISLNELLTGEPAPVMELSPEKRD